MNGPTAASPPPPPMAGPRQPSMGGASGPPYPPGGMMNMQQQQQHNLQHSQQQLMPPPQMMNIQHLPPQLQQHLATLPPQMQQQFMQQHIQQQQQMHHQQQQQHQPPQPPQQQQAFVGQQPTAQMLAHMNNVINGQGGPQQMQNNPAFRAAALAAAQAHAQGKPFNPDDKGHPLHPSQMQNFLQAQARAQAQMQASSAAPSASQPQPGPPIPPPSSTSSFQQQQIPNHASPRQQTHYIQPPNMPNRQTPTLAPTLPPNIPTHILAASASSSASPVNQVPQQPPQHMQHPHGLGQLSQPSQAELQLAHADPIAGPSNPRAILNQQQQQQQHHDRRPSMDQIALMQRLSQMAQKGGLPIQSLFTKTSWMTLSSTDPEGNEQIPNFTEWDKKNLEIWMEKDLKSVELVKREKMRIRESLEELAQDILDSQDWLGPVNNSADYPPVQSQQFHIRSKKEMERDLSKGKRKRRPWLEFSKKQLRNIAKIDECLIPIRLDLEHEGRKFSDTFTWNLNDTLINPSIFADIMCEDLLLPNDPFHSIIMSSIHEQIKQFQEAEEAHPRSLFIGASTSSSSPSSSNVNTQANDQAYPSNGTSIALPSDPTTKPKENDLMNQDEQDEDAEQEEEDWWEGWRKKVKLSQAIDIGQEVKDIPWHEGADAQDDISKTGNEPPVIVHGADELRVTIQLDIAIDNLNLRDQFEWDLSDPQNSPEEFAAVFCADLGLPGEFRTAVSHLIREQLDAHSRSLSSIRHIRGDQILHDELRNAFHSTLSEAIRSDDVENWTPHLGKLDLVELEHRERERERQSRRHKRGARNNRRNVVTLPDREPLRTSRTMMPKPGAVLEIAENTGPDDPASVPSYATASPYPLVPVKYDGPPPRMSSPLRRTVRKIDPVTGAVIVDANAAALPVKMKPGKKRGRPAFDSSARETAAEGTPPPGVAAASITASPAPGVVVPPVKRPVGRPPLIKKPAGWTRIEMTTHENIIDGKWHCTNCGVPEPVAVGRRKGPAGPNTQCAECGKYFMSNKGRLRPCEYTTDPAYHQARQMGFPQPAASTRHTSRQPTPGTAHPDSPGGSVFEPESGDESKPSIHDESFDTSRNFATKKEHDLPMILPPARKSSTPAYPVGAGKGKGKGNKGAGKGLPPFPKDSNNASANDQQRLQPHQKSLPPIRLSPNRINSQLASSSASPPNPGISPNPRPASQPRKQRPEPPAWMTEEMAKLQRERPDDRFEIILKPKASPDEAAEWRLKCLDCPGKVYKTGPDKTLDNFSAHLRFKGHRTSVNARLALEL